jgi:hypothetical protein
MTAGTPKIAPGRVTPETLRAGLDEELSRFVAGPRALLVVRLSSGWLALVSVALDDFGEAQRVLGVFAFPANRGADLERLISVGVRNSRKAGAA